MKPKPALVVLVTLTALTACGTPDDAAPPTTTTTTIGLPPITARDDQPPNSTTSMALLYDAALAPLDLRVSRASVGDRDLSGAPSTHLALYLAPTRPLQPRDYLDRLTAVAAALTPDVFDRWPGVDSYDICLEPHDQPYGTPITQFAIHRTDAAAIAWHQTSIDLLQHAAERQPNTTLVINEPAASAL